MLRKDCTPKIVDEISVDGTHTSDPNLICAHFNDFFINIGPQLQSEILTSSNDANAYRRYLSPASLFSIFLDPSSEDEIVKIISTLKSSAPGYDDISPKVVKCIPHLIRKPLCHIFNLSMPPGIVPPRMKVARVIPVFKSGDPLVISNYRPISILPCFSKILEKIIFTRMLKFLIKTMLFLMVNLAFFLENLLLKL
ncbi:RNA-directed DNA polymerase from mobile element jockey [Holothuria leucospilota]|uniref:RNA-directed DNA polymerase from mobile element jockey n=1 Tax=Holothuria leucospilota TaxID=206669 RepID=A0A9Q1BBT5_HOLLE|nr:RNA-directed DNA polymerase from mobile element jockey [Holothuria leucospilota]